jgi:hypothetical protein
MERKAIKHIYLDMQFHCNLKLYAEALFYHKLLVPKKKCNKEGFELDTHLGIFIKKE